MAFLLLPLLCFMHIFLAAATAEPSNCEGSRCRQVTDVVTRGTPGIALIQRLGITSKQSAMRPDFANPVMKATPRGLSQLQTNSMDEKQITIVSYNLYWWNVGMHNRWRRLFDQIREQKPFGLIGFQECNDVARTLDGSGLLSFDSYQGPSPNPCPIAWDGDAFEKISEPDHKWVANDRWGDRWMNWVRLKHKASGRNIFFTNTHGPLGNCGNELGNNWASGIKDNMKPDDLVFMTGDYNCVPGSEAMNILMDVLKRGLDGGIDQILTNSKVISGSVLNGWPSDHPLLKGVFSTNETGADDPPEGNWYRRASRVGSWGGWCTCPDGQRYNVGDNWDSCGSIACEGGVAGECFEVVDQSRNGMKVTCAPASSGSESPQTASTTQSTTRTTQAPTTPAPTTIPAPTGNNYRKEASGVGGWGGWCTCPDGQKYNVGDNFDGCGSLACEGGIAGECVRVVEAERDRMKVTCAAATTSQATTDMPDSTTPEVPATTLQPTSSKMTSASSTSPETTTVQPTAQPTSSTTISASPNNYRKEASGVGGWGGWCTCPNGDRYKVGDNFDGCGSLACDGGVAEECVRVVDPEWDGMKVTCAIASSTTSGSGTQTTTLSASQPEPSSTAQPSPTTTLAVSPNNYRKEATGVGGWGGWCTCPNGERYKVGDNFDGCGSLACEGGIAGECERVTDPEWDSMKVTCGDADIVHDIETTPPPQPTQTPAPNFNNKYRKEETGVGGWGGWCTCPDGRRYEVGDNLDSCGSLACEGGIADECQRVVRPNWDGMKVTCAAL